MVDGTDASRVPGDDWSVFDGDDYDFDSERSETDPGKYSKINGAEGNLRLDTEDLDEAEAVELRDAWEGHLLSHGVTGRL